MGIGFITAFDFAVVWLVRCVDVGMFFPIRGVSEATIASRKLTLERLFSCVLQPEKKERQAKQTHKT